MDAERNLARLGIDHLSHFAHRLGERPGEARDHRIAMAQRQQCRGKNVAVLIDHAFYITLKKPAPLQAFIQEIDHRGDMWRTGGIVDLIAVRIADPQLNQLVTNRLFAADQHRGAITEIAKLDRRAQHHVLLGFGKDHPLGVGLHLFIDLRQHRCRRVEPRFQAKTIGVKILDQLLRHARIHRRFGDGGGNHFHQARIKWGRDDVIRTELVVLAIGRCDLFGHLFAREFSNRPRRRDLHFLVNRRRPNIERAAENEREAQNVVDLVWVIRPASGDDGIRPHGMGIGRGDLRIGVGHGKDDRVFGH